MIQIQSAPQGRMTIAGLRIPGELATQYDRVCRAVLLTLCFVVPVQPILPVNTYRFVEAVILVMAASTLLLHRTVALPASIRWSFWIGAAGWVISTCFSSRPLHSFDVGMLEFFSFYVVLYLALVHLRRPRDYIASATLFAFGAGLVAAIQTWTILEVVRAQFRALEIPTTFPFLASQFLGYKNAVPQFFPSGVPNTYGNIDNYSSLWVLLLPWLLGLLYAPSRRWLITILISVHLYAGLIVYSRGGIIAIALSVVLLWLYRLRCYGKLSPAIGAALLMLAGLHIDQATGSRFTGGLISFGDILTDYAAGDTQAPGEAEPDRTGATGHGSGTDDRPVGGRFEQNPDHGPLGGPGRPHTSSIVPSVPAPSAAAKANIDEIVDQSGADRAKALLKGISIAVDVLIPGIGYGIYPIAEPVFTSPHSMAILRLAEGGLLSLISFAMLAAYAPALMLQMIRNREHDMLSAACLCAVTAFMTKAIVFGASFAISSNIVWGFGVALCMATSIARTGVPGRLRAGVCEQPRVAISPGRAAQSVFERSGNRFASRKRVKTKS